MLKFKLSVAFILIVLVVVVVLQNTDPVDTRFLFMTVTMSHAALLAITAIIGMAVGILLALIMAKSKKK